MLMIKRSNAVWFLRCLLPFQMLSALEGIEPEAVDAHDIGNRDESLGIYRLYIAEQEIEIRLPRKYHEYVAFRLRIPPFRLYARDSAAHLHRYRIGYLRIFLGKDEYLDRLFGP